MRRRKRGRNEQRIDGAIGASAMGGDNTRFSADCASKYDGANDCNWRISLSNTISVRDRIRVAAGRSRPRELKVFSGFRRTIPRFLVFLCSLFVVIYLETAVAENMHDIPIIEGEEDSSGGRETVLDLDEIVQPSPQQKIVASETKLKVAPSPLIVCMVVDGTVFTLDSSNGEPLSVWATGRPLVGASRPKYIFPGLDGQLYLMRQQHHGTDDVDATERLPMTIQDVLAHPVRTCLDSLANDGETEERQCGIVAATKVTTLFGVDTSHGQLLWTSHHGRTVDVDDASVEDDVGSHVILQREDFMVHHVSTTSGTEFWNATLGYFSALDFEEAPIAGLLESGSPELQEDSRSTLVVEEDATKVLPSIGFSRDGTTLLAVQHGQVVWQRKLHAVIATVYGIAHNRWTQLEVLEEGQLLEATGQGALLETLPMLPSSPPTFSRQKDIFVDMLWKQIKQQAHEGIHRLYPSSSLVLYQPKPSLNAIDVDCTVNGSCRAKPTTQLELEIDGPKLADQDFIPPFPGTTSYDNFDQSARPWQVQPEGLLLTWNMVFSTVLAMIGGLVIAYKFYQHKKRKWTSSALSPQASNSGEIPAYDLDIPLRSVASLADRKLVGGGGTITVKRSQSLPMMSGDDNLDAEDTPTPKISMRSERWKSGPTTEAPTAAQTSTEETRIAEDLTSHLDGIPLVRYSRYKSEFTEMHSLGKGGFGTVFQCQNVLDGRHYAMKKISVKTYQNPQVTKEQLERVLREVKILALLDHPNIVRYYTAWLEMEAGNDQTASVLDDSYLDSYKDTSKWRTKCFSSEFLTNGESMIRERPSEMELHKEKSSNNPLGWNNFLDDYSMSSMQRPRPLSMDDSVDSDFGDTSTGISSENVKSVIRATLSRKGSSNLRSIQSDEDLSFRDDSVACVHSAAIAKQQLTLAEATTKEETAPPPMRHTLYIQMQFCSGKSLQDFLLNPQARQGKRVNDDTTSSVDIPLALNLFGQIAQGVKHVHAQGLIHRDLKPSNCFMDGNSVVKVGDFGLSRSSAAATEESLLDDEAGVGLDMDQTAGVGTRSYASPEQMNGSDYDSATDVYSLGIILFELCYPMYTGMERIIVFTNLRKRIFPKEWTTGMATTFPVMHDMMCKMLSTDPAKRPSSSQVASTMERILSEFTVLSIDKVHREAILLRVESETKDSILQTTMELIRSSAPSIQIEQYGLRGGASNTSVMEFALSFGEDDEPETGESLRQVLNGLKGHKDIKGARQVSSNILSSRGPRS